MKDATKAKKSRSLKVCIPYCFEVELGITENYRIRGNEDYITPSSLLYNKDGWNRVWYIRVIRFTLLRHFWKYIAWFCFRDWFILTCQITRLPKLLHHSHTQHTSPTRKMYIISSTILWSVKKHVLSIFHTPRVFFERPLFSNKNLFVSIMQKIFMYHSKSHPQRFTYLFLIWKSLLLTC